MILYKSFNVFFFTYQFSGKRWLDYHSKNAFIYFSSTIVWWMRWWGMSLIRHLQDHICWSHFQLVRFLLPLCEKSKKLNISAFAIEKFSHLSGSSTNYDVTLLVFITRFSPSCELSIVVNRRTQNHFYSVHNWMHKFTSRVDQS